MTATTYHYRHTPAWQQAGMTERELATREYAEAIARMGYAVQVGYGPDILEAECMAEAAKQNLARVLGGENV